MLTEPHKSFLGFMVHRRKCTGLLLTNLSFPLLPTFLAFWLLIPPHCSCVCSFLCLFPVISALMSLFFPLNISSLSLLLAVRLCPLSSIQVCFFLIYIFIYFYSHIYESTFWLYSPFHKATAIYTPIHAKAVEVGAVMQWGIRGAGEFDMSHHQPDLQVSPWTISPPFNLWRVQGSAPFAACLVRTHPPA